MRIDAENVAMTLCVLALAAVAIEKPKAVTPVSRVADPSAVRFEWTAIGDAASYTLIAAPSPDFAPMYTKTVEAGLATSAKLGGLWPDKEYCWRVIAKGTNGTVLAKSFPAYFRTAPSPTVPPDCRYADDIPLVDISGDTSRQRILADGTLTRYMGHAYTIMAPDRKTVWAMFTSGADHAVADTGPLARTTDGGRTWLRFDERLPVDFRSTHHGSPIIRSLRKPDGSFRYVVFTRDAKKGGRLQVTYSDDLGESWQYAPTTSIKVGMGPTGFIGLKNGKAALFGQTPGKNEKVGIWMSVTPDCGETWPTPRIVVPPMKGKYFCEPFCIRSPDGSKLALILREQTHTGRSMVSFSSDEGETWTTPVDTPWGLTGDRHEGTLLGDGRLFIAFRDRAIGSSTAGQYVGWVGTWDDLENCRPGQYRVKLLRHFRDNRRWWSWYDCGYGGVHELADGTILCTTYLKNAPDERRHSVMSTRFKISETDALWAKMKAKEKRQTKGD